MYQQPGKYRYKAYVQSLNERDALTLDEFREPDGQTTLLLTYPEHTRMARPTQTMCLNSSDPLMLMISRPVLFIMICYRMW